MMSNLGKESIYSLLYGAKHT